MPRRLLAPLLAGLSLLVAPAAAPAATNVSVGIGDQSETMFADPSYKALGLKKTRYFIEWNAVDQPGEIAKADRFVAAARQSGVRVLMHISTDDINAQPRSSLPSARTYRRKVSVLINRYKPQGVKEWGVWNEANHKSQPTQRNPKRAAQFFAQMRAICTGCTLVALDVLDQAGVEQYIDRFFKAVGRSNARKVKVVGIHNYSEVNRRLKKGSRQFPGTKKIIDATRAHNRSAKFWYTETGGLVKLGSGFPCDSARAANRTRYMFTLTKKFKTFVKRLYTFNWSPTPDCETARFDAGLVNPDGTPRPAYGVLKSQLKNYRK